MHKESERRTRQEVNAVALPVATRSYCPIPNSSLIDMADDTIRETYGRTFGVDEETGLSNFGIEWSYALGQKDMQLFAVAEVFDKSKMDAMRMMLALRNSYNKSLSAAFAAGASVFACTNLLMSGSDYFEIRKHTTNALTGDRSVENLLTAAVKRMGAAYERQDSEQKRLAGISVSRDRGYELTGLALGHGIIKPQQASIVLHDWDKARHEVFAEGGNVNAGSLRNGWGFNNCLTEAIKNSPAGHRMELGKKITDFCQSTIIAGTGLVEVTRELITA